MGESTKGKALEKLDTMDVKVGYPDIVERFSELEIKRFLRDERS